MFRAASTAMTIALGMALGLVENRTGNNLPPKHGRATHLLMRCRSVRQVPAAFDVGQGRAYLRKVIAGMGHV
jgi:hypothetical protein